MHKSPLVYPGGKSKIVDVLYKKMPSFSEYREAFLGGGSVLYYTKQMKDTENRLFGNNIKYWVNDLFFELYNFWRFASSEAENMVKLVNEYKSKFNNGKELHAYMKKNIYNIRDIHQAVAFYVVNRLSFSGTTLSGGYSQRNYDYKFNDKFINNILNAEKVLRNVNITNLDYSELLSTDGDDVFLFLDPPYYSIRGSYLYGKNGDMHKNFNHEKFADDVKNCKHKYMITYDNSEYIRKLFSFANIDTVDFLYYMSNHETSRKKFTELVITNY